MGWGALHLGIRQPNPEEGRVDENITILQPLMIQANVTSRHQEKPTPPTSIFAQNLHLTKSLGPSYKNKRICKKPYHGHIISNTQLWETLKDNQPVFSANTLQGKGEGGNVQVKRDPRVQSNPMVGLYLDSDSN